MLIYVQNYEMFSSLQDKFTFYIIIFNLLLQETLCNHEMDRVAWWA